MIKSQEINLTKNKVEVFWTIIKKESLNCITK